MYCIFSNGFDDSFMVSYYCTIAIMSLVYLIPLIVGIYLVCRNNVLSISYKIGWINGFVGLLGCVFISKEVVKDRIIFFDGCI